MTESLGDRVLNQHRFAVAKATFIGAAEQQDSNVMQGVDEMETAFTRASAIEPPYNPNVLMSLFEMSNSLRQNIDAYATNIDGFGHTFKPVIDLDAPDADARIMQAMYSERLLQAESTSDPTPPGIMPTEQEVAARKVQLIEEMRVERSRIEHFFDFCCDEMSFVSLRRKLRQDLEQLGNAYLEVLRDTSGQIVEFVYVPGYTVRLRPLDKARTEHDTQVKISDIEYTTIRKRKFFRTFVQVLEHRTMFFKEYGDPRVVSRRTGGVVPEGQTEFGEGDGAATELMHFKLHSSRSCYGIPRWIGNLLSVFGSRQAEEINHSYFENKSVPPMAILVSGGQLAKESVKRLESFFNTEVKGKKNFHKVVIIEGIGPDDESFNDGPAGQLKVDIKPLTDSQLKDGLFQSYDERNIDKVGMSFRLPRLLRGDIRDFNRACYSADTETLTENGWKLHDEIAEGERISVYVPETGTLRFDVPAKKYVYQVDEELVRFVGQHTDLLVTSNHKLLVRCPGYAWVVECAEETANRTEFEFACAAALDVGGPALDDVVLDKVCKIERGHDHAPISANDWLEFLGYFLSDGGLLETAHPSTPFLVFIRQKKQPYLDQMRACLDRIGWSYSTTTKSCGTVVFTISNRCLRDKLARECGGRCTTRRMPDGLATTLPREQLAVIWEALKAGDGGKGKQPTNGTYYSASKALIDDVQIVALRLGLRTHVKWVESAGVFVLGWSTWQTTQLSEEHVERQAYKGEVFCFSCPDAGFFVTRRNGKVSLQGNSAEASLEFAEQQVFGPERGEFDWAINRRIFPDLGIRFWKFESNTPTTKDPASLSEIIVKMVAGNIITPGEGRELAQGVFNTEFTALDAVWTKQPVALTLAGVVFQPEPGDEPYTGEEAGVGQTHDIAAADMAANDLASGGGLNRGGTGRQRPLLRVSPPSLAVAAKQFIGLRDALLNAERQAANKAFMGRRAAELRSESDPVEIDEVATDEDTTHAAEE